MSPATAPNNLPLQLTSFVGREREIAEVERLLHSTRLLTLTGTGGCGKTRLALEVASRVLPAYEHGVWLVELAALSDAALVAQTVATALGLREAPGRTIAETLVEFLRERSLLLVLDNCEHLLDACARLADSLLRACPRLRVLATSREALGIGGEVSWRVPSLSLPDAERPPSSEDLAGYEAVRLFTERARAVQPRFEVTSANSSSAAAICRRLDGIPLAIELAAARVKALTVEEIAARLDDRFRLLTGGSRTALPRQQTLRALIDWSYDLLSESERGILRRLSTFAGSWTLAAAEAVCAGDPLRPAEVLDLLAHLVDKSLVQADEGGGQTRYRLLETIRQYARDKLVESGEASAARDRHLDYFLQFAETAAPALRHADQLVWLARLDVEHDNLRAALEWSLSSGQAGAAVQMAGALHFFWYVRGYFSEGASWLEAALGQIGNETGPVAGAVGRALRGRGWMAHAQGDFAAAGAAMAESVAILRALGDSPDLAQSLNLLANVLMYQGDTERARPLGEEGLAVARRIGDDDGIGYALFNLGAIANNEQNARAARSSFEQSLATARKVGDRWLMLRGLGGLSGQALSAGDHASGRLLAEEALGIAREIGDRVWAGVQLGNLGLATQQ
jgi:non-specific serine/threonine protein kinase